ncbi:MAG: hypothetical protein JWR05_3489 [Mucilaginibacter sp.]|nr:hypothetical protein [Mucilaginibacter sp.]
MLKAAQIKKLKDLGIDTKKLFDAVKAEEEVDFELPEINNLTEDQLTERDKNTVAAAKPAIFKEGKTAGIEIANKAIVNKFGLTDIDTKDVDKVIAGLDSTVVKGDAALKEQVKLLQTDKATLEAAVETEKKNSSSLLFDTELITSFPTNRRADMSDKDYLLLVKNNLSFEEVDGVKVVKKDGQVLRDKTTQAPIPLKDAISSVFGEKKWIAEDGGAGGRGGVDNPGGGGSAGIKTYSKAMEQFIKDNPDGNPMSPAAEAYVSKIAKATTDFSYDD